MWKLNVEDDQANVTTVNLVRDEYSVGRDVENAIRLTERNISRKHAILKRNAVGWILVDERSYNGCFVNGKRIAGEHRVENGDLVQLGDYRLELLNEGAVDAAGEALAATGPIKPLRQTIKELPDRLVMIAGPAVGIPFTLAQKRIVIGRAEDCDLPINDTSVSRVHAEIQALGDGRYEVVDRGSSNGVRINGVELKRTILDAGDVVELGDVQLKFVPAGQMYQPQDPYHGARRTPFQPASDSEELRPRFAAAKLAAIGAILVLIGVIAFVATRGTEDAIAESPGAAQPDTNPAAQALEEAQRLLAAGDTEGALQKSKEIPPESNLRETTIFKEIQARWAEGIFDRAHAEPDKARKRSLLDLIAKSPDVGSVSRKRAVNEIADLDADSVDIADLPTATKNKKAVKPSRPSMAPASARPQRAAAPAEQPAPTTTKEVKGGLVRETPF